MKISRILPLAAIAAAIIGSGLTASRAEDKAPKPPKGVKKGR